MLDPAVLGPRQYVFSTDEFALGLIGPPFAPGLGTEAPPGDASADVWVSVLPMPPGPIPPMALFAGHTGIVDGDGLPSGSGFRCAGGGLVRMGVKDSGGGAGIIVHGPGLAAAYGILPFSTFRFHTWYRDPGGPCGSGFNTSSAVTVNFLP